MRTLRRLALHSILAFPLAIVSGFGGFLVGSPITGELRVKVLTAATAFGLVFLAVFAPLCFYYGIKEPGRRPYRGNLIAILVNLFRLKSIDQGGDPSVKGSVPSIDCSHRARE